MFRATFTLIAAACLPFATWAQVSASLSGRIEDPSGMPVAAAIITVRSLETGALRTASSDGKGNFEAGSLSLGPQEVRVEKQGFKTIVRTGVSLAVGQQAVLNLRLEVGDLAQQVNILEETPLVNTTTASVSGVVGSREIRDLPLNGRSFDNLITLNPGTVNFGLKSANTSTSNGSTFSVSGRRPADNLVLMNGIEYTGSSQLAITPGGVSGELLGIDAIREFNVLTDTYPAEFGKRSGAQIDVVTQSGTNALHGSLFEFLRNSALDARNYFDQSSAPPFRRNQFGGALGGPLKKDKLFLFGNYEGFEQVLALSSVSVVPDAQARLGIIGGTPVANVNPAMLKYFSLWPIANGPELGGGAALSYNNPRQSAHEHFGTARADYAASRRDTFSMAYTIDDGNSVIPQADPLFGAGLGLRNQVASVEEVHIFSPTILNTFRVGLSRASFTFASDPLAEFPANLAFVTGGGPGGIVIGGGTTTSGVAAITAAGPNNAANVSNHRNLFTVTDGIQINKGIHQITAGFWLQRIQDNEDTASRRLGQASFSTLQSFLTGNVTTLQVVPDPNELGWRSVFGAWYVQDSIRLRPNLTLQLGLRHEFTTGWNEVAGRAANYITDSSGVLQTAPITGNSVFTKNNATKLFGPRVGLAWDVFGNGKTAVRAGYGTYYSLIDDLSFLLNSLPPYNGAATYSGVSLPSVVPIAPGVQPPASCGPGVAAPCSTFAPQGIQPDAKTPAVQEWNLRIEQQLSPNTVLRVSYVGSFGVHGLLNVDPNTVPATVCSDAAGCLAGGTGSTRTTVATGTRYIPVVSSRPNPYLGAGFFWYTEGNSSYNSLQTDVTRRLTHGLQLRGNFTWSKNLDINSALTGAQASNQAQMVMDRNDIRRDWGLSALNVTAQSSISARYELPGKGRLAGGWQVNGIATLLSGFPFTPQDGSNRSGDGNTRNPDRPSLNPAFTGAVVTGNPNQWFNPAAFVLNPAGTFGNLGRGVYSGPTLTNLDMSLFKNLPLRERINLQFRAEFFNILNHTNFASPNPIVFANGAVSPSAGLITSTVTTSRQIQFGLKLIF